MCKNQICENLAYATRAFPEWISRVVKCPIATNIIVHLCINHIKEYIYSYVYQVLAVQCCYVCTSAALVTFELE